MWPRMIDVAVLPHAASIGPREAAICRTASSSCGSDCSACSLPHVTRGPAPAGRAAEPVAGEVVLRAASPPPGCHMRLAATMSASSSFQSPRPGSPGRRLNAAAIQHASVVTPQQRPTASLTHDSRPPSTAVANNKWRLTRLSSMHLAA